MWLGFKHGLLTWQTELCGLKPLSIIRSESRLSWSLIIFSSSCFTKKHHLVALCICFLLSAFAWGARAHHISQYILLLLTIIREHSTHLFNLPHLIQTRTFYLIENLGPTTPANGPIAPGSSHIRWCGVNEEHGFAESKHAPCNNTSGEHLPPHLLHPSPQIFGN